MSPDFATNGTIRRIIKLNLTAKLLCMAQDLRDRPRHPSQSCICLPHLHERIESALKVIGRRQVKVTVGGIDQRQEVHALAEVLVNVCAVLLCVLMRTEANPTPRSRL